MSRNSAALEHDIDVEVAEYETVAAGAVWLALRDVTGAELPACEGLRQNNLHIS